MIPPVEAVRDYAPTPEEQAEVAAWNAEYHATGSTPVGKPLDEAIEAQAARYRALGNDFGDLIAETLSTTAKAVRDLNCRYTSVRDFKATWERAQKEWEWTLEQQAEDRGYERGLRNGDR